MYAREFKGSGRVKVRVKVRDGVRVCVRDVIIKNQKSVQLLGHDWR
jgi:hypothetical protein